MVKHDTGCLKKTRWEKILTMKANFSIMVVALILAAFALAAPVSAGAYSTVAQEGTVFIGEESLDISAAVGSYDKIAWFPSGSNPSIDSPGRVVDVTGKTDFYVSPSTFTGRTDAWYRWDGSTSHGVAFYVENPQINVLIWDIPADKRVDGESIARTSRVDFRVESNLHLIRARNVNSTEAFDFDIRVAAPSGSVYNKLVTINGDRSIDNVPLTGSLFYWANKVANDAWNLDARSGSARLYPAGEYKVHATCGVNSLDVKSVVRTFFIASEGIRVESNVASVTRGGAFSVTVTGQPNTEYHVFVKSTQTDPAPVIISNQYGVSIGANPGYITEGGKRIDASVPNGDAKYFATVTTDSSGKRTIGFQTYSDTQDRRYTIRAENKFGSEYKSGEVTVTVSTGQLSLVTDKNSYYLGDEIVLAGVNTETESTYFFITGPNLPNAGGKLDSPREPINVSNMVNADVREDDSYDYKWRTDAIGIDSGTYTVYAVSEPRNRDNLQGIQYATVSIIVRKPTLSAEVTPKNAARGDEIIVAGSAGTDSASGVMVWIFGKNYVLVKQVSVDDDASYELKLTRGDTGNLADGQYYVVVQHPMYNNQFDVWKSGDLVVGTYPVYGNTKFKVQGSGSLQSSEAATALINAINDPSVDDLYVQNSFIIEAPYISITNIPRKAVGDMVTVTGTTNLAVGNEILVEVLSSSFKPTDKVAPGTFSGSSSVVKVVDGGQSANKFVYEFDTDGFKVDEYRVSVTGIVVSVSGSSVFDLVAFVPTPTPTPTPPPTTPPTTQPTTVVTEVPTPVITPDPTVVPTETPKSPGFGALIALIGLGVVSFLIVRKPE